MRVVCQSIVVRTEFSPEIASCPKRCAQFECGARVIRTLCRRPLGIADRPGDVVGPPPHARACDQRVALGGVSSKHGAGVSFDRRIAAGAGLDPRSERFARRRGVAYEKVAGASLVGHLEVVPGNGTARGHVGYVRRADSGKRIGIEEPP